MVIYVAAAHAKCGIAEFHGGCSNPLDSSTVFISGIVRTQGNKRAGALIAIAAVSLASKLALDVTVPTSWWGYYSALPLYPTRSKQ